MDVWQQPMSSARVCTAFACWSMCWDDLFFSWLCDMCSKIATFSISFARDNVFWLVFFWRAKPSQATLKVYYRSVYSTSTCALRSNSRCSSVYICGCHHVDEEWRCVHWLIHSAGTLSIPSHYLHGTLLRLYCQLTRPVLATLDGRYQKQNSTHRRYFKTISIYCSWQDDDDLPSKDQRQSV